MSIQNVSPGSDALEQVISLAKKNKRTLGFLPNQGFLDRAKAGTLLCDLDGGIVRGYVLYDLPRDEVRIVHLCVGQGYRGKGIARALVDALWV